MGKRLPEAANAGAPCLPDLFAAQVRRCPTAAAIHSIVDGRILTYRELDVAVAVQASALLDAGVGPGSRVALVTTRSVAEAVVSLAVCRVGAAYAPIDADTPAARKAQLIDQVAPDLVMAQSGEMPRLSVACLEPSFEGPSAPVSGAQPPVAAGSPAVVVFTSGSSGVPKAIQLPHRALVRLALHGPALGYQPGRRCLRFAAVGFDVAVMEVWATLCNGATLVVPEPELCSPGRFAQIMAEGRVDSLFLTSGLLRVMERFAPHAFDGVEVLVTGGDIAPAPTIARLLERHPRLTVINGYGPAENSVVTTAHAMQDATLVTDPVPIGREVGGSCVAVVDDSLCPATTGELLVGGDGLADGYLDDPGRTERSFIEIDGRRWYRTGDIVRRDDDGTLWYLGRRDDQVKVRGFRVELGEVEVALRALQGISDVVVVASAGDSSERQLLAAFVSAGGMAPAVDLRREAARCLPAHMLPARWVAVDQVPVTAHGKVDRAAVLRLFAPVAGPPLAE